MALSWSARRQLLYYIVAIILAGMVIFALWKAVFTTTPTCFDNIQNGSELGIDCGGTCSLLCTNEAQAPRVLWARSFLTAPSTYTAAAYVQNLNQGAGARAVSYSFELKDADNLLVAEKEGTIDIPPVTTIPVVEPNIAVGNRVVAHTLFNFSVLAIWNKIPATSLPALHASPPQPNADYSRVSVVISNDGFTDAKNILVTAILFDSSGTAQAASKSVVDRIPAKSSQTVVFTWPAGTPSAVSAEIDVLPSF